MRVNILRRGEPQSFGESRKSHISTQRPKTSVETRQERRVRGESKRWYLVFVPLFAVVGLVEIYPLIMSTYISLTNLNGQGTLSNYATMVATPAFWSALNISLLYSLTSTIIALAIGLGLTFILSQEIRGKSWLEAIYILPLAVAPIVVGVLFSPSSVWDDIQQFLHFQFHLA